jgi:aspartyl protease family protein
MNEPNDDEHRRTGRYMLLMAWVGGLALLTLVFQDLLSSRFNPNTDPQIVEMPGGDTQVVLERNAQGHYVADGRINGVPVTFLVDTGASDVAVPEDLANRLRLERRGGGISQTANGPVAVWKTVLDSVSLGSITLRDVRASILPSMSGTDTVLLGMSFMKQLDFTQRDGRLVIGLALPVESVPGEASG